MGDKVVIGRCLSRLSGYDPDCAGDVRAAPQQFKIAFQSGITCPHSLPWNYPRCRACTMLRPRCLPCFLPSAAPRRSVSSFPVGSMDAVHRERVFCRVPPPPFGVVAPHSCASRSGSSDAILAYLTSRFLFCAQPFFLSLSLSFLSFTLWQAISKDASLHKYLFVYKTRNVLTRALWITLRVTHIAAGSHGNLPAPVRAFE